ncbi:MAG: hypothetical protein M1836_006416 [Candelina mexicana]|nr:MAG: hypothetical protein M1836_006416 [Candelina mexicana]
MAAEAIECDERKLVTENYRYIEITPATTPNQQRRALIGVGASSSVLALDKYTCEKIFTWDPEKELPVESKIFDRLGSHPRIVRRIRDKSNSIVLERLPMVLRKRFLDLQQEGKNPSREEVLRWAAQTAEGLQYLHENGVLQSDMGCHNLLLDHDDNIKFCDFSGSSIDGSEPTCCYESRAQKAFMRGTTEWGKTTVATEIFALGTALYEISTTEKPYPEIDETTRELENLYLAKCFPPIDGLLLGPVISKCWNDGYREVRDALMDIRALQAKEHSLEHSRLLEAKGNIQLEMAGKGKGIASSSRYDMNTLSVCR